MPTIAIAIFLISQAIAAPDLELKTLTDQTERLSDYRGKIVVLNFWATWCVPCQKEMPLFVDLQREFGPRGVQFIGASIDDASTRADVPNFVRKYKVNFPIWLDAMPEQQFEFKLATAVPATVILDRDGTAVFRIIAETPRRALVDRLNWLLSDRSAAAPEELVLPKSMTAEHFKQHELGLEDDDEDLAVDADGASEVPS